MANDFPTPNSHVDELMHLLTGDEYKVLSFVTRHILGWKDRRETRMACISITMLCEGYTAKTGAVFHGTGLSRPTIVKCLASLVESGLIDPIGDPTPDGQVWFLPSKALVSEALNLRADAARSKAETRMAHARSKRGKRDLSVNGVNRQAVNGVNQQAVNGVNPNKQKSQTQRQTHSVVVVSPEPETGELHLTGELPQPQPSEQAREGSDSGSIEATTPLSPSSAAPLSPDKTIETLIASGVQPKLAARLVADYGAERVDAVWAYMQNASKPLGIGFLRHELRHPFYVVSKVAAAVSTEQVDAMREAMRIEAMRRETERWAELDCEVKS